MRTLLIGDTPVVYHLARRFISQGKNVTIVHDDEKRCQELALQTRANVIYGKGTTDTILEQAGAREADVLIALTPHDQDNLIACQVASRVFGVPRTVAIANDPKNEAIFHKLGIHVAFSPTQMIASIVEQEIAFEQITRLMPLAKGRVNVTDVHLTDDSLVVGKTLEALHLSQNALIACVIRQDDVIVPRGQTQLQAGDHLILIHPQDNEFNDLQVLCKIKA